MLSPLPNPSDIPSAEPISAGEFADLMAPFGPFAPQTKLALAISGGPDSMALAWCMKHWAQQSDCQIQAFIVDHALRPESRFEAQQTQQRLQQLGIAAEILRWDHPPLVSRIHLQARKARYGLLNDACKNHGCTYLLTAHHQDDQGETILMRLAKGSGIDGLAGIPARSRQDELTLLRPFLPVAKARLLASCKAARLAFVTDTSNASDHYARGRLRRVLPLLASEGLTPKALSLLGQRAAAARDALDHYTDLLIAEASAQDITGAITFHTEKLRAVPVAIIDRALTAALQAIHPQDYPPDYQSVTRLRDLVLTSESMAPRTLHGCLISQSATQVQIAREAAAILATAALKPGGSVIWDQRWRIAASADAPPGMIRPLGHPPHEVIEKLAPGLCRLVPQGRLRASLPAVWSGEMLVFIPVFAPGGWTSPAQARLTDFWPDRA